MTKKINRKSKLNKPKQKQPRDDNPYILKLVICLILGSIWVNFGLQSMSIPIPIGALLGVLFIKKERLSIDRKIEYAILLLAMFISFWLPTHINITFV